MTRVVTVVLCFFSSCLCILDTPFFLAMELAGESDMPIVIRLQHMPLDADFADIRRFFSGISIPEGRVHIVGGEMGDVFIGFSTDEDARLAMAKDGGKIHEMQIKLLFSSYLEMTRVINSACQQNSAPQAHMSPIQPPPMMIFQQPILFPAPSVNTHRLTVPSSMPHRARNNSPTRRSQESRRDSSKRERSRSPAIGSRCSSQSTDRRNDSYKLDDRDEIYFEHTHSQVSIKYPETDSMNRPPARAHQPGEFRDATNQGYYEPPAAPVSNTLYNFEASRNVSSTKAYPTNSYYSRYEKNSLSDSNGHNRMDMQLALNQQSSNVCGGLPPSFNLPSFDKPDASNKEADGPAQLLSAPSLQNFGNPDRPRRPLIPTNDGTFGEHPPPDYPPSDSQQIVHPQNGRRSSGGYWPYPNFPAGGYRSRPDFPGPDRFRSDMIFYGREPFFHPRVQKPRMNDSPTRGMRYPIDRSMRPPFDRMRGPFPLKPRGSW